MQEKYCYQLNFTRILSLSHSQFVEAEPLHDPRLSPTIPWLHPFTLMAASLQSLSLSLSHSHSQSVSFLSLFFFRLSIFFGFLISISQLLLYFNMNVEVGLTVKIFYFLFLILELTVKVFGFQRLEVISICLITHLQ